MSQWKFTKPVVLTGDFLADGNPMGYVFGASQHIVYRTKKSLITELYWSAADLK